MAQQASMASATDISPGDIDHSIIRDAASNGKRALQTFCLVYLVSRAVLTFQFLIGEMILIINKELICLAANLAVGTSLVIFFARGDWRKHRSQSIVSSLATFVSLVLWLGAYFTTFNTGKRWAVVRRLLQYVGK